MPLKYICFSSFEEKLFSTSKFTLSYLVLVIQSCPTLCDPRDYSPPSFSVHGILQARILEWDAIPFSSGSSQSRDGTQVTCIASRLFTVWTTREDQFILRPQERKNECEVAQLCPTPYDPMDYSLPGSSIHGIFEAKILKWVAISFIRGSSRLQDQTWAAGRIFNIWATREAYT